MDEETDGDKYSSKEEFTASNLFLRFTPIFEKYSLNVSATYSLSTNFYYLIQLYYFFRFIFEHINLFITFHVCFKFDLYFSNNLSKCIFLLALIIFLKKLQ